MRCTVKHREGSRVYWEAVEYTAMELWAILGITVGPWIMLGVLGRALVHTGTHWEAPVHIGRH